MKPRLLLTVIAVAALAIAGATVIFLSINQPSRSDMSQSGHTEPANRFDEPGCEKTVTIYFETDDAMTDAAPRLEQDNRIYSVVQETKAQAYERFTRIFKDRPDLVANARPEVLPASLTFGVNPYDGRQQLLAELRRVYAPAEVVDLCELSSRTPLPTAGIPTTGVPTTGPADPPARPTATR